MDIWTEEDERQLLALETRRKNTFTAARDELLNVMARYTPKHNGPTFSGYYRPRDLADAMIANGGEFRDALLPFDHMGRPKARPDVEDEA